MLNGFMFELPAVGLQEQRSDLRRTLKERCEMAAALINAHTAPAVAWCNLNEEGNTMARLIPDAVEICGSDTDDKKESVFRNFADGKIRVLVTKPTIAGFGLNWQHCAHETFFPSHSYEQYYQSVRRCWRFGQKQPVTIDLITTEGQNKVLKNMQRKAEATDKMFERLVAMMWNELRVERKNDYTKKQETPKWL